MSSKPGTETPSRRALVLLQFALLALAMTPGCSLTSPESTSRAPAREAPARAAGTTVDVPRLRFAHIGNPLVDFRGKTSFYLSADSDQLLYDAFAQLHSMAPVDVLMIGGNCIHNTGKGSNDLDLLVNRTRLCQFPVRAIMGPRDTRGSGERMIQRGQVLARLQGKEIPGSSFYYSTSPGEKVSFIVLDSTESAQGQGGSIGRVQMDWLERELAATPSDTAVIVFLHHMVLPAWGESVGSRFAEHVLQNAAELREVLSRNAVVKMVCSSSLGTPSVRTEDGVHYVATPALCHYPCAFRRFVIVGDRIEVETRTITEQKIDTLAVLAVREDPQQTWKHYAFADPDQFMEFLRGSNEDWQLTLTMR